MGSDLDRSDQRPSRSVSLSAFYLGATPVTVAMWKEYCLATNTEMPPAPSWGWLDDHPVVNVSWDDIMGDDFHGGYVSWASEVTKMSFCLPTEAQFEYALKLENNIGYHWGTKFDSRFVWTSVDDDTPKFRTASVFRSTSVFCDRKGLTDMIGNVKQWCLDWYGPYQRSQTWNPRGTAYPSNARRSVRGADFSQSRLGRLKSTWRDSCYPTERLSNLGFRLTARID
jgi:sulfatase modifying factor 1